MEVKKNLMISTPSVVAKSNDAQQKQESLTRSTPRKESMSRILNIATNPNIQQEPARNHSLEPLTAAPGCFLRPTLGGSPPTHTTRCGIQGGGPSHKNWAI